MTVAEFDVTPPEVAVMVEVPTDTAVARPVLEIFTAEDADVHVAIEVMLPVELSE